MRDYYIEWSDGSKIMVAEMTIPQIHECLDAMETLQQQGDPTHDDLRERLNIELLIRRLGF